MGTPTVEFTVTNLRKKIGGVPCVVVWDRDVNEGELKESELSFWAQDDFGNVWNTAEYPEEYQNGVLLGAENTGARGGADAGRWRLLRQAADPERTLGRTIVIAR